MKTIPSVFIVTITLKIAIVAQVSVSVLFGRDERKPPFPESRHRDAVPSEHDEPDARHVHRAA